MNSDERNDPKKTPDYLARWRIPLGLAVAVLLTLNLVGGDWFGKKAAPVQPVATPTAPASTPAPTPASTPPPARLDPAVWLIKIEALLDAGDVQTAHEEWRAFRQVNPDYPVDHDLQRRLEKAEK